MENIARLTNDCITWIREWFDHNGNETTTAVLGLSGGKDSTIAAALIARAIGPDRVIGVAMPEKNQSLNDADKIAHHLGIHFPSTHDSTLCRKSIQQRARSKHLQSVGELAGICHKIRRRRRRFLTIGQTDCHRNPGHRRLPRTASRMGTQDTRRRASP